MKKNKCEYCKKGEIYKNERSNANLIILNNSVVLSGNMETTIFQTLFCTINYCPICGDKL